ncbi:hypothetical protein [Oceanobacillus sp. CAU 1775]
MYFKSITGQSVDPTDVTLTIYDTTEEVIEQFELNEDNRSEVGVYFYDYVTPTDKDTVVFEYKGIHNSNPIIVRNTLQIKFN